MKQTARSLMIPQGCTKPANERVRFRLPLSLSDHIHLWHLIVLDVFFFFETEWRRWEIVKAVFPVWLLKPDYWQNAVLSLWFIALCSSRLCPSICFIAIWKVWMFFHSFFYCKSYSNTRISVHKSNCLKANKLSPDSAPLMFKRILFHYCKNISLLFCQIKWHTVHSIFTKEKLKCLISQ